MMWLISGLVLLIGIHLIPTVPRLRHYLVGRLGEAGYRAAFSLIAVAGLGLIILGMGRAPFIPVWEAPAWGFAVVPLLMLPACVLVVGAYLPGNLHRLTPHPMSWGVVLWAVGHLFANSGAAALLLFGSLGLYSLLAIWSGNRRGAVRATTRQGVDKDLLVLAIGVLIYVGLAFFHPLLFGAVAIRGL
jgi:uncharacterized membrane protein